MLPFFAGLVVGSALTLLYAKREEVKKAINSPEFKSKVQETKRASSEAIKDIKKKIDALNIPSKAREIFVNLKGENTSKAPVNSNSESTANKRTDKKVSKSAPNKNATRKDTSKGAAGKSTAKTSSKNTARKTTRAKPASATKLNADTAKNSQSTKSKSAQNTLK